MSPPSAIEQWQHLQAKGARVRYRPVEHAEIAKAEAALGFRFPPSYVALVTTLGAPAIDTNIPRVDRELAENLPYAVLLPDEIVQWNKELRGDLDPEMFEDPTSFDRVAAQLNNAVLYQFGSDAGEGYVFLLDTTDEHGEPIIGDYSHDYLEELDWSPTGAVFPSLAAATANVMARIEEYLADYS
jgi:hypothetical protein